MVENRPIFTFFAHLVLILGVVLVVFPIYVAFVASTQPPASFLSSVTPVVPGSHLIENYRTILLSGAWKPG